MISVRNPLQPLSGNNKWLAVLIIGIVFSACSPKIVPTVKPVEKPPEVKKPPVATVTPPKAVKPVVSTISLILPFDLDKLDMSANATRAGLSAADIAAEYYQGFKLALDSLTAKGYNYKLQVFDSKGEPSSGHSLANNPKVRNSDLIVGPVFPDILKSFTASLSGVTRPVISPLSPAPPEQFKIPNLITATPPLQYHAIRVARYINDYLMPTKVFILKSGYTEDNKYILPFIAAVDSISKKHTRVISITVVRGNLDAIIPQLSTTKDNVFIVPSTDQAFLTVTLTALDKLGQNYPVALFGHPNWAKVNFLAVDMLQRLKTCITLADKLDYKSVETANFIKKFRKAYQLEPGEYAFKGFDQGYYFGNLLSADPNAFKALGKNGYNGLRSQFNFVKTNGAGWVNTNVGVYQYDKFELKLVE